MQRNLRKVLTEAPELAVFRAEVVTPLTDAVRLVDGDIADAELLEQTPESLAAVADETLGRDVQQPAAVFSKARKNAVALVAAELTVQISGGDAVHAKPIDLIFHQRVERRDNQGEAATAPGVAAGAAAFFTARTMSDKGGRLKAEGFAAAGGQDREAIAPVEDGVHRLALERSEVREAPDAMQHVPQG